MKNGTLILNMFLLVVPIVLAIIFYPYLPAQIPIHFSLGGNVSYAGKLVVFLIALLPFFVFNYWKWRAKD